MFSSSATPWTVACQARLSMGFSRQEYWSGLPFPSPGDLPKQGIEPTSPALVGGFFTTEPPESPTGTLLSHNSHLLSCQPNLQKSFQKPRGRERGLVFSIYDTQGALKSCYHSVVLGTEASASPSCL